MIIRKYFALSIVAASIAIAGCSSSDDDEGDTGDGTTTTGGVDAGGVDAGGTDAGGTDAGGTDAGGVDAGGVDGGMPEPVIDTTTPDGNSILDVARGTDADGDGVFEGGVESLSSLVGALGPYQELLNILDDESQMLTVFAPNNDAFAAAQEAIGMMDAAGVENTLRYHVVVGQVIDPSALSEEDMNAVSSEEGLTVETAQGGTVTLTLAEGGSPVMVNDATVVASDASPVNGIVHIIDAVLAAPEAPTMGGDEGGDDSTGGEDAGDTGGGSGTGAPGTPFRAIQDDDSLSAFEALVVSSGFDLSLQDANNNNFLTFAPTNATIDPAVTTAAAYIVSSLTAPTTEGPPAGTYNGTGEQAVSFDVSGSGETLMVNGLPASFVTSGDGGALVKYGN